MKKKITFMTRRLIPLLFATIAFFLQAWTMTAQAQTPPGLAITSSSGGTQGTHWEFDASAAATAIEIPAVTPVPERQVLIIKQSGDYTIGMASGVTTTRNRIRIAAGRTANITLNNVTIAPSGGEGGFLFCAFQIEAGATVNLTLNGTNSLTSAANQAGLNVPEGSGLLITAANDGHSLTATGGQDGGAGIGGNYNQRCGMITITGGTVTATGGLDGGAGIGNGRFN
jgi:hypothetical protein